MFSTVYSEYNPISRLLWTIVFNYGKKGRCLRKKLKGRLIVDFIQIECKSMQKYAWKFLRRFPLKCHSFLLE